MANQHGVGARGVELAVGLVGDVVRGQRRAAAQLDRALARSGMPRSERRRLLSLVKDGTQTAADDEDTPRAVDGEATKLSAQLKGIFSHGTN
jgi:hypothetical protein